MSIDIDHSIKELLKSASQEAINLLAGGNVPKEEFVQSYRDYTMEGLTKIIASISATYDQEDKVEKSHQPNPPWSGAIFDEQKHRWINPSNVEGQFNNKHLADMASRDYYMTSRGDAIEAPSDFPASSKTYSLQELRDLDPETIITAKFYSAKHGGVARHKMKVSNIVLPEDDKLEKKAKKPEGDNFMPEKLDSPSLSQTGAEPGAASEFSAVQNSLDRFNSFLKKRTPLFPPMPTVPGQTKIKLPAVPIARLKKDVSWEEEAKKKGIHIEYVSKKDLKDYEGMNWVAAKVMGFPVCDRAIWILDSLNDVERKETIKHELKEAELMLAGKSYHDAHFEALKFEKEYMNADKNPAWEMSDPQQQKGPFDLQKSHSRDKCMSCDQSPTKEYKWAEGMAHAWFCNKHGKEFEIQHRGHIREDGSYEASDIDLVRFIPYGVASEKWSNGVPSKEASKDYLKKSQDIKLSAKAIVKDMSGRILLLHDGIEGHFWDLPGGHIQQGETLTEGLHREVKEEIGANITSAEEVTIQQMKLGKENKPTAFFAVTIAGDIKLSHEHERYVWVTADELDNYNLGEFKPFIKEAIGIIQKAERIYLKPGQQPPGSSPVKTGGKGGRYYEAVGVGATPENIQSQPPGVKPQQQPQWTQPKEGVTTGGIRIPPNWKDVQVATDPNSALQAIGKDSKGRKVYLYSTQHATQAAAIKFGRLKEFSGVFPSLRSKIEDDFGKSEEATCLYLIMKTGFRIGSDKDTKAKKQAYGASTINCSHIKIEGNEIKFHFTAKKGVEVNKVLQDNLLSQRLLERCKSGKDIPIFETDDSKVRQYLHQISGKPFKVKDFRTYLGTSIAMREVNNKEAPKDEKEASKLRRSIAKIVAEELGNTPEVALQAYIAPEVFSKWGDVFAQFAPMQKAEEDFDVFTDVVYDEDIPWEEYDEEDEDPDEEEDAEEEKENEEVKKSEETMNITDFLNVYEALANNRASETEIDMLYKQLGSIARGTDAQLRFIDPDADRLSKVIAIDSVAHDIHSANPTLMYQMFPNADRAFVKSRLDELAGLEISNDVRAVNRGFFSTIQSESGFTYLQKQVGKTTKKDISKEIKEYQSLYEAQLKAPQDSIISNAELSTLWRYTKDSVYKSMLDERKSEEPLVIGGYASVEVIDREGHLITSEALEKAFDIFMKSFRTRNIMIAHSDVQVGWALPAWINKDGEVFKSGTDDKGLYLITEVRPDSQIADRVRKAIESGEFKSYSIAGTALKKQMKTKGTRTYMQVDELELAEITICEKPVNQDAHFTLLKSSDKPAFHSIGQKKKQEPIADSSLYENETKPLGNLYAVSKEVAKDPLEIEGLDKVNVIKEVLRRSIMAEYDAINLYEQIADQTSDSDLKELMLDIAEEEKVHVGEFEHLLAKFDDEHEQAIQDGINEAKKLLKATQLRKFAPLAALLPALAGGGEAAAGAAAGGMSGMEAATMATSMMGGGGDDKDQVEQSMDSKMKALQIISAKKSKKIKLGLDDFNSWLQNSTGPHGSRGTGRISFRQSKNIADKMAQTMGWKDHADALSHRDSSGKVGHGPAFQKAFPEDWDNKPVAERVSLIRRLLEEKKLSGENAQPKMGSATFEKLPEKVKEVVSGQSESKLSETSKPPQSESTKPVDPKWLKYRAEVSRLQTLGFKPVQSEGRENLVECPIDGQWHEVGSKTQIAHAKLAEYRSKHNKPMSYKKSLDEFNDWMIEKREIVDQPQEMEKEWGGPHLDVAMPKTHMNDNDTSPAISQKTDEAKRVKK